MWLRNYLLFLFLVLDVPHGAALDADAAKRDACAYLSPTPRRLRPSVTQFNPHYEAFASSSVCVSQKSCSLRAPFWMSSSSLPKMISRRSFCSILPAMILAASDLLNNKKINHNAAPDNIFFALILCFCSQLLVVQSNCYTSLTNRNTCYFLLPCNFSRSVRRQVYSRNSPSVGYFKP